MKNIVKDLASGPLLYWDQVTTGIDPYPGPQPSHLLAYPRLGHPSPDTFARITVLDGILERKGNKWRVRTVQYCFAFRDWLATQEANYIHLRIIPV